MTTTTDNYFELYGLPPTFQQNAGELADKHHLLMSKFHPDKFVQQDSLSRRQAAEMAALLNDAYTTLKSPLKRAGYLLMLAGVDGDAEQETTSDTAFLMEQLELREEIELASNSSEPFAVLDRSRKQASDAESVLFEKFESQYAADAFAEARESWVKLNFFTRLKRQIDQAEQKLEDA